MARLVLSLLMVLMTCSTISFSYPSGAPISACETMKPGHNGVYPQPNPAPYTMKINASSYQYGRPIAFQILGPAYRGILLQAWTHSSNTLYGTWLQPPSNTKILACPENPFGSITHSNTNLKDKHTTYIWMPPNSSCSHNLFFIPVNIRHITQKTLLAGSRKKVTVCRSCYRGAPAWLLAHVPANCNCVAKALWNIHKFF